VFIGVFRVENYGLGAQPDDTQAKIVISPQTLTDSRDLAMVALQRTRMPITVSDPRQPDNPVVLANAAFLELTGYTASEVVGRNCRFLQGPGTDRKVVDQLRQAIANEREIEVEILNYRKDGSSFWNTVLVSPVHDEKGQLLYFFASQKDETERLRATALEAIERKLLKEIDHRAKNALAVVQSVVRLTPRDDAQAYAASIEGRVEAIARAHRLLAEFKWSGVPVTLLFQGESGRAVGQRIALSGPDTLISATQVQPLGLFIHEVFDNATKHGALSNPVGRLDIRWENGGPNGQLTISVQESGGPSGGVHAKEGLGQRLMKRIATHQLGGKAEFEFNAEGLQSTITLMPIGRETNV
jgi:PAS domain S-box-containing protein